MLWDFRPGCRIRAENELRCVRVWQQMVAERVASFFNEVPSESLSIHWTHSSSLF